MEIVDYLRVARRRLWVLVGVPVLATGVAAGIVLLAPQQYSGTAYVAAPALVGGAAGTQYSGTQAANQFVAAFGAAVTSPRVLADVAADTGVVPERLRDGLTVTQVGASSQLEVRYAATKRANVAPVLTATTTRALAFLFSSQVGIATGEVEAANADVTAATKAIGDWEKLNKVSQPDRIYQATLGELTSLRQQRLSMQAVGNGRGPTRRPTPSPPHRRNSTSWGRSCPTTRRCSPSGTRRPVRCPRPGRACRRLGRRPRRPTRPR